MEIIGVSPNKQAFYYTSAPTSPRRYNLNGFYFLSMPTSPTRQPFRDPSGFISGARTTETPEDFSPLADNFEFEGSKRFYLDEIGSEKSQDLSMAYADELFYDGKMLPLRPPPIRAQSTRPNKRGGSTSTASSPGVRSSMLRVPFVRQRMLWNDEFDPFMAALSKVKEENYGVNNSSSSNNNWTKAHLRRAKSLSPLRWPNEYSARWTNHKHKRLGLSPDAWMEINGPREDGYDAFGPIQKPMENLGRPDPNESKKQRIKKFLVKNASFGRESKREKREQRAPLLLRKLHSSGGFGSARGGKAANSNAILRISREMKSLMKHRARVFFCLVKGFGAREK